VSRVLVVEDESHLAEGLRFNLEAEGYEVDVAGDGNAAIERLAGGAKPFDVVVLDVMLPFKNGFEVVAAMREARNFAPVLILTARSRPEDVLKGFAAGADDYLPKPFELPIFLARLQGLLRRTAWLREAKESVQTEGASSEVGGDSHEPGDVYQFDGKKIDFSTLELRSGENTIHLTLMEANLLRHLIANKGKVVTRKSILEQVWGLQEDTDTRAIDNFIVRLRKYIEEDPSKPQRLVTVRGLGYRFIP
jgi:DNA-binding response OmpR family regulator